MYCLAKFYGRYYSRVRKYQDLLEAYSASGRGRSCEVADLYFLEGLLSQSWQEWCRFCREVVMAFSLGCRTYWGLSVAGSYKNWEEVSFVAVEVKKGASIVKKSGINKKLYLEPTWGDADKLLRIIDALNIAGAVALKSGFGSIPQVKHLQVIRNAAAHLNSETIGKVYDLQPYYKVVPIKHPLQAMFWREPASGKFLFSVRLEESLEIARYVCA